MKKFIAGFLTCLVLMSGFYVLAESQQWTALRATFDVYVNGKKIRKRQTYSCHRGQYIFAAKGHR